MSLTDSVLFCLQEKKMSFKYTLTLVSYILHIPDQPELRCIIQQLPVAEG